MALPPRPGDQRRGARRPAVSAAGGNTGSGTTSPRPLGDLVARLSGEGQLQGTRLDGRPVGSGAIAAVPVSGIGHDSRVIEPGWLFVAVRGQRDDGHDHAADAVARGAAALIVERPLPDLAVAQLVVADPRVSLASAAAWWYGDPSRDLTRRRHHRHGRQDDDLVPRGRGARGGRDADRDDRHDRDAGRRPDRGSRRARDDARGAGAAGHAPAHGRRRRHRRDRRDHVARPRARTGRRRSTTTSPSSPT